MKIKKIKSTRFGLILLLSCQLFASASEIDLDVLEEINIPQIIEDPFQLALPATGSFPNPNQVYINKIAYAGTGCKAGSVSEILSEDSKAFTLLFDNYVAQKGPGIAPIEARKNCQIALDLRFPSGWSYTIFEVDYRGYAGLERGAIGTQKSSYYFAGQAMTANLSSNYVGPYSNDYQIRDTLGLSAVVWSPCGANRALNINTQVRIERGSGIMTTDSIDGELTHIYRLMWRRCGV